MMFISVQYRNGSASGVADMSRVPNILDALAIMRLNPAVWSETNDAIVMSWFRQYLDWYTTSTLGNQARQSKNNIALWYHQV
jgi:hypothetical protein